ncbi:MAG TPA: Uma2 family endonuclease, partial [Planctomycetota bacterium]|nr:Uma2 family endonuclease [Planctomycetota bacterium]
MTTPHDSAPPGAALARPPLENGDRLSRDEFHRRYRAQPHGFRAELIEGRVYVSSPVSLAHHGTPAAWLAAWLGTYAAARPEVAVGADSTVILDEENEVQPDVVLRIRTEHGGRTRVDEDGFLRG